MIRRAGPDDVDFILEVARHVYPLFDEGNARQWLAAALQQPVCAIFRGEVGVAVGTVSAPFYWPSEVRGFLVFIGSMDPRRAEGVRLARSVVEWAKTMGATSLRFGSQTDCSLAVLARRLGAKEERPAYLLEI